MAASSSVCKPVSEKTLTNDFLAFLNASPTAFHAVANVSKRLLKIGFVQLDERDAWDLKPSGRYFFTRNTSTIVAFAVGAKFVPGRGVIMVGAHTDSPCPKLKPVSSVKKSGMLQIGVQCYGGGLWTTWFDRDLSVAGRVLVDRSKSGAAGSCMSHELVHLPKAICCIPSLAIHLNRKAGTEFIINKETHLDPVIASSLVAQLNAKAPTPPPPPATKEAAAAAAAASPMPAPPRMNGGMAAEQHHSVLLTLIAEELKCDVEDIVDFELQLCDTQPSGYKGAFDEFISSGRLDNLGHVFMCTRAMCDTTADAESLADEESVRAFAFFDHEEIGSKSAQGAGGPIVMDTFRRIASSLGKGLEGITERTLQSSFLISADMAHGVHPNYGSKHQREHQSMLQQGIVIKHNCNQRYATNVLSAVLFRQFAARAKCPLQEFVVRNDCACGSTIGPIVAGQTGLRTVDVGAPQWAMHSCRETMGVKDVVHGVKTLSAAYKNFTELSTKLFVDTPKPQPKI